MNQTLDAAVVGGRVTTHAVDFHQIIADLSGPPAHIERVKQPGDSGPISANTPLSPKEQRQIEAERKGLAHELGMPANASLKDLIVAGRYVEDFKTGALETALLKKVMAKNGVKDLTDDQRQIWLDRLDSDAKFLRQTMGMPENASDKAVQAKLQSLADEEVRSQLGLGAKSTSIDINKAIIQHGQQEARGDFAESLGLQRNATDEQIKATQAQHAIAHASDMLGQPFDVKPGAGLEEIYKAYEKAAQAQLRAVFAPPKYPPDMTPHQAALAINAELDRRGVVGHDNDLDPQRATWDDVLKALHNSLHVHQT